MSVCFNMLLIMIDHNLVYCLDGANHIYYSWHHILLMVVLDLLTGFRPIKSRMPIGTHFSAQNLFLTTNRNNWVNISKFSINRRLISSSNNKYSNDNAKNCTDNINVDNYKGGKYFGKGFPLPSGPDENELPKLEFGKPTGMYKMIRHSHGDPRGHLNSDGTIKHQYGSEEFHWQDNYTDVPKQNIVIVDGEKMIIGKDTRPMEKLYGLPQVTKNLFRQTYHLPLANV